ADVGDEAPALLVDRRLIRRAALQVVMTDQLHVLGLGAVPAWRRLGGRRRGRDRDQQETEEHRHPYHHSLLAFLVERGLVPRRHSRFYGGGQAPALRGSAQRILRSRHNGWPIEQRRAGMKI